MEARVDHRPARDTRSLAPCRIQAVLGVALAASSSQGQKMRQQGIARADLSHGSGKFHMGRAAHSRRTENAWLRSFGATVLRWMRRAPSSPEPAKRWAAFLSNHREAIAAMDFFTVPTLTFGVLYCFFVIAHDRRRILQCQVTGNPTNAWVIQQLREAFPYDSAPGYLIFDRGPQFNNEVIENVKSFGSQPSAPASEVHGRTALPNAGSVPAAGICSTM